jgi:hypothetical protein
VRTLLWKEWHEHVWKLAFGSLILGAFALIGLRARVVADETLLEGVCILAVLLLPVLASTGLIPAERSDGTLDTLLALPVRPLKIFAAKAIMGVLLCAGPILFTAIISIAIAGEREAPSLAIASLFVRTVAATLSLLFWMICATVNLPNETRAALIALGVQIIWLLLTPALDVAGQLPWLLSPYVFLFGFDPGFHVRVVVATTVQAGIAALLWWWTARQFSALSEGKQ